MILPPAVHGGCLRWTCRFATYQNKTLMNVCTIDIMSARGHTKQDTWIICRHNTLQSFVLHRQGATCSSILPAVGQCMGALGGRGVIVLWTSHTTIIQQSYNNPYNNPYNNSFFLDEERIVPRDENKKIIYLFYREREFAPRARKKRIVVWIVIWIVV